jgi:probable rRNA maturation factor
MPLTIAVTDARGRPVRVAGLAAWLRRVAPRRARGTLTIALVTDAEMRKLNREFRGRDYATDVLSFPASHLGDLAIAKGVARRQARQHGHTELVELKLLALHGLLHLLGYDHERDAGEMHRVEQRLRRRGGLREGLIERA